MAKIVAVLNEEEQEMFNLMVALDDLRKAKAVGFMAGLLYEQDCEQQKQKNQTQANA